MPDARYTATGSMREWKWTQAEKVAARRAFNLALKRELDAVLREAKERAARISEPSELWDLEVWLTERRREIDRSFDYRYSVLPLVFVNLLRSGRLAEDDLHGLASDKLDAIRYIARS